MCIQQGCCECTDLPVSVGVKEKGAAEMGFGGQTKLPTDERTKIAVRCEAKAFGCCAKAAVAVAVSALHVSDGLGEWARYGAKKWKEYLRAQKGTQRGARR